ncbi:MAG: EI24 domain-containing protein [Planctomycetota bacterium]
MAADLSSLPKGIGGFVSGVASVPRGINRLLSDAPLRKLAMIPLLITTVLYIAAIVALFVWGADLLDWAWPKPSDGWLKWLWYVVLPLGIILIVIVIALLFSTVAEAVGGPFYDKMAMRVLEGEGISTRDPGLFRGTIPDMFRSLLFVAAAVGFGVLSFIPVIGLPFAILGTSIAWVGLAAAAVNPALLVTGYGIGGRLRYFLRSYSALAGMGVAIGVVLLVPLAGLIAIPGSVVGASALYARSRRAA